MFFLRLLASIAIFIPCLILIVLGWFVVPVKLLLGWQGYNSWWGNRRWGTGATDPAYNSFFTKGSFLSAYNWLAWRNPINNFSSETLAIKVTNYTNTGNPNADTNSEPGFCYTKMGWAWEYLWVWNYSLFGNRCIYLRFGWKINGATIGSMAQFACTFNPWISYSGKVA